MIGDFFYRTRKDRTYQIEESILDKVRNLKSKVSESGYYDYMVEWDIDVTDSVSEDIWKTMQILTMVGEPTEELTLKYNLNQNKYLVNLMRLLYIDIDVDDKVIRMGYKRPFGNSHILGDIKEELEFCGVVEKKDDYDDDYEYEIETKVLIEFSEFISDFLAGGFELRWHSFDAIEDTSYQITQEFWSNIGFERMHSYLSQWIPSKFEIRDKKINKILNS